MGTLIALPVMFVVVVGFWWMVFLGVKSIISRIVRSHTKAELYDVEQQRRAQDTHQATADENALLKEALAELLVERKARQAVEHRAA